MMLLWQKQGSENNFHFYKEIIIVSSRFELRCSHPDLVEVDAHAITGVGPEALVGIALVFGVVSIAFYYRASGKLHYPAVLVSCAILDSVAREYALHAGDVPEYPPAF